MFEDNTRLCFIKNVDPKLFVDLAVLYRFLATKGVALYKSCMHNNYKMPFLRARNVCALCQEKLKLLL